MEPFRIYFCYADDIFIMLRKYDKVNNLVRKFNVTWVWLFEPENNSNDAQRQATDFGTIILSVLVRNAILVVQFETGSVRQ